MSDYVMYIFLEKKAKLFTNSGDPDRMPHSAAFDLGLHFFASYLLEVSRIQLVISTSCYLSFLPSLHDSVTLHGQTVTFFLMKYFSETSHTY